MVERFNGRIEDVQLSQHFTTGEDRERTFLQGARLQNGLLPQPALKCRTLINTFKDWRRQRPE